MGLTAVDGGLDAPLDDTIPEQEHIEEPEGLIADEPEVKSQGEEFEFAGEKFKTKAEAEAAHYQWQADNQIRAERLQQYEQVFGHLRQQREAAGQQQLKASEEDELVDRMLSVAAQNDPRALLKTLVKELKGKPALSPEEARQVAVEAARQAAQAELEMAFGPMRAKDAFLKRKDLADIHDMADQVIALQGRTNMNDKELAAFFRSVKGKATEAVKARARGRMESAGSGAAPQQVIADEKKWNSYTDDFWSREF